MSEIKIGLIKENKIPIDKRVPMTPVQCRMAMNAFPQIKIVVQSSEIRCFTDQNYREEGIEVVENVEDCDILMGVKEVPKELLIPDKTYFFFSHTIKEQAYNRELLQTVLQKRIRLIDYEVLTDKDHKRIIAFGRYAGIVGAYNGIWTFGKRYNLFDIRRAYQCFDLEDLKSEFARVKLPAIKIAITGGGRVARGSIEVLHGMMIRRVTPAEYLSQKFDEPVFTQLNSRDYHVRRDGGVFSREEFHAHPERYKSSFEKFTHETDLLIAGAFWNPVSPVLFTREDCMKHEFRIHVIADITCDIEGSIPSTKRPSTIEDPIYDYNPSDDKVEKPFSEEANITVMAVDNLPCELPRDASRDFGNELINNVLPQFWNEDRDRILARATIAENGELTEEFSYLSHYVGLV